MVSNQEIAEKLWDMAVNTGTLNCLGCGFEHNCSVHGCAVLKQAAELISQPNEPLTCEGCYWQTHGSFGKCIDCIREKTDHYCRPPEGEANE